MDIQTIFQTFLGWMFDHVQSSAKISELYIFKDLIK